MGRYAITNLRKKIDPELRRDDHQIAHALNTTATQFASHPSRVAASALPIAAVFGFVPGLMMGFKKG